MSRSLLFLGGNGHSEARLEPARRALMQGESDLQLVDALYPGFEDRPRTATFDQFLTTLGERAHEVAPTAIYATGIGGLFALALRARGELTGVPIILQGTVLWGLEQRAFARAMRGPMPILLKAALRTPWARRRFRRKHLAGVPSELERDFFRGYERCASFADFFKWLRAPLLRSLERELPATPHALEHIQAWWGEKDRVVGLDELAVTERALGTTFPRTTFADWGHYPMLEDPAGWSEEVDRAVA